MTGVTVASTLLEEVIKSNNTILDITIYEAGRGIGGRMSTRYTNDDSNNNNGKKQQRLQFDHGCQYIGPAKTEEFKLALQDWNQHGWIQEWKGKFGRIVYNCNNNTDNDEKGGSSKTTTSIAYEDTTNNTIRYVGNPKMNSICENIISHSLTSATVVTAAAVAEHLPSQHQEKNRQSTLTVITDTRIQQATSLLHNTHSDCSSTTDNNNCYNGCGRMWQLTKKKKHTTDTNAHSNIIDKDNSVVVGGDNDGYYDWLVVTDLSSARSLIENNDINTNSGEVDYIPICTTMITLNEPLTSITVDGIEISPNMENTFGVLGWIARDSSKPGRRRHNNNDEDDKRESWILQSSSQGGKAILDTMKGKTLDGIREGIRKTMVNDFTNAIPHLISVIGKGCKDNIIDNNNMPTVIDSVGHRWGAAFPHKPLVDMDCYIDTTQQLVVCGDYFGPRNGRVEGAFVSGRSAARNLIRQIMKNKNDHQTK